MVEVDGWCWRDGERPLDFQDTTRRDLRTTPLLTTTMQGKWQCRRSFTTASFALELMRRSTNDGPPAMACFHWGNCIPNTRHLCHSNATRKYRRTIWIPRSCDSLKIRPPSSAADLSRLPRSFVASLGHSTTPATGAMLDWRGKSRDIGQCPTCTLERDSNEGTLMRVLLLRRGCYPVEFAHWARGRPQ